MSKKYPLGNPGELGERVTTPSDRASQVRRSFSYQDHAGLVLLYESLTSGKYTELWFEHHDDIIAVRPDGICDVYQVKTKQAAEHKWRSVDQEIIDALSRFCLLEKYCPHKTDTYFIFSNGPPFVPAEHSRDIKKDGSSLPVMALHLRSCGLEELDAEYADYFARLEARIGEPRELIAATIRKLNFKKGRAID